MTKTGMSVVEATDGICERATAIGPGTSNVPPRRMGVEEVPSAETVTVAATGFTLERPSVTAAPESRWSDTACVTERGTAHSELK